MRKEVVTLCLLLLTALPAAAQDPNTPPKDPPPEAERRPSGLVTQVLFASDSDESPDANDHVSINYIGWTPAGAKFESSYDRGQPAAFSLERIFPGWREGIQLMTVGERRRMWIPAHMTPPNPKAGPRGAAIFDVELMGVKRMPNPPRYLSAPPENAEKTPYGAASAVLEEGDGIPMPEGSPGPIAHWVLWTEDGHVHSSSLERGRPTLFPFDKVMPAFADVLRSMTAGEKRHIWIPENVAAGNWAGNPRGNLTFEVQIVRFAEPGLLTDAPEKMPEGGQG